MTNDKEQITKHKTQTRCLFLYEWEELLAPQLQNIQLIGEISLTEAEANALAQRWQRYFSVNKFERLNHHIPKHCPASFAVFLVTQGVYHYSNKGYWKAIGNTLQQPLDPNQTAKLGECFEKILIKHHLPLFPDMIGYRFVSLILAHGGIPAYCLPDYFGTMLYPTLNNPWYSHMTPAELIQEWLHYGSARYQVDKPILNFLAHGEQVAQDFVARTIDLAHYYHQNNIPPQPQDVGLPTWIVEQFHHWVNQQHNQAQLAPLSHQATFRFRQPKLNYAPWGQGLTLNLYPQQIPATYSQDDCAWQIDLYAQTPQAPQTEQAQIEAELIESHTLPVHLRRSGYDLRTTATQFIIQSPIYQIEVSFTINKEIKRTWHYQIYNPARPLLTFNATTAYLQHHQQTLPTAAVWLLYPQQATLSFQGQATCLEEFPRPVWDWYAFKAECWDLSQATQLYLTQPAKNAIVYTIRPDQTANRPYFSGGTLFESGFNNQNSSPLYLGHPPQIHIPLVGRQLPQQEAEQWRLTIRHQWTAHPMCELIAQPLSNFSSCWVYKNQELILSLTHATLLGAAPYGNFIIHLRGPLGRDAQLPLRILPHLEITGHENLIIPHPKNGPPPVDLIIETDCQTSLNNLDEDHSPCLINSEASPENTATTRFHYIKVPPTLNSAALTVLKTTPQGDTVRVPLHIPLQRLQWTLIDDPKQAHQTQWSGTALKQSLDALLQAQSPLLLINIGHTQLEGTLNLLNLDDKILQTLPLTQPHPQHKQNTWQANLAVFLDTIRHSRSALLRLQLTCKNLPTHPQGWQQTILSISKAMLITHFKGDIIYSATHVSLHITWQEENRLRNRCLRLWSLWQPWHPCLQQPIPDDCEGHLEINIARTEFNPGLYRLQFLVIDPWAPPPIPTHPPPLSQAVFQWLMVPPDERLATISHQLKHNQGAVLALFIEKLHIYYYQNQLDALEAVFLQYRAELDSLLSPTHFSQNYPLQVLALCKLLTQLEATRPLNVLSLKLFASARLQQWLIWHQQGQLSNKQFEQYLNYRPRTELLALNSCLLLLQTKHEQSHLYAIMQLLKREHPQGVMAVLQKHQAQKLSDTDAIDLLSLNLNLATATLLENLKHPAAVNLLQQLAPHLGAKNPLIKPKHWVYTQAGWGRIEAIEDLNTKQSLPHFIKTQANISLQLSIRPTIDNQKATLHIHPDRIILILHGVDEVYCCTKQTKQKQACQFITANQNLLMETHNRLAHNGLSPKWRIERKNRFISIKPLTYSLYPPKDRG